MKINMENNKVFKKIGEDVRVNELAIISRPELVEIGNEDVENPSVVCLI